MAASAVHFDVRVVSPWIVSAMNLPTNPQQLNWTRKNFHAITENMLSTYFLIWWLSTEVWKTHSAEILDISGSPIIANTLSTIRPNKFFCWLINDWKKVISTFCLIFQNDSLISELDCLMM
eukprot:GHVP01042957.1.p2 GENE.GHVP01042957.1~~GHVP01042957.1.p2  ORF type:complete len:121 (+),score=5.99 GHVP01042957.1:382-744(+)